ncbi:hypothetical protein KY289_007922 [Solanum tuberosum]|nr:hypothetical protein KY289_007922 [Solanum tuberosum]
MNVNGIGNSNVIGDNEEQAGEKNNMPNTNEQSNNVDEPENDVVLNEKYELREGESQNRAINRTVRRKKCINWTENLRAKFMEVVEHLVGGSKSTSQLFNFLDNSFHGAL